MSIEDLALLGGFAATMIFGYYIVSRWGSFLDRNRRQNEERERACCLYIATSCLNAIPAVSGVLKDIKSLYPNARCCLSVGRECEVMRSFERGEADVAIIPVDSDVNSEVSAQWRCVALNSQSFSIDNGGVEVSAIERAPQYRKVLWRSNDDQSLVLQFIDRLSGQRP